MLRFRAARWAAAAVAPRGEPMRVDYFYFRNYNGHSLNLEALGAALEPDDARAAYACQCAWQTVAERKPLGRWGTEPGAEGGCGGGEITWRLAGK